MLKENILETIGNTPIVKLNRIKDELNLKGNLYAKIEFYSPGLSKKDRIAKYIIEKAINDRISILSRSNSGEDGLNFGINESSLEDMEKFIALSRIVNKTMSDTGNGSKTSNEVKEYLKVSKQFHHIRSKSLLSLND